MSLESFLGLDQGEGMSEAAFEALREKMKAAAAQIAAIKREEKKQKKKEEELLRILLKFVKNSHKTELTLLISRVLEQNLPANFVLAVILLGNEDIQREIGSYLMLKSGSENGSPHSDNSEEKALTFFSETDDTLPLKIKIEIDNWIKNMLSQAEETPQKLLKTSYDIEMIELPKEFEYSDQKYKEKKVPKTIVVQLLTFVLRDFLEQNRISEPYSKLFEFAKFIFTGILNKTAEGIDNRKLLGDQSF